MKITISFNNFLIKDDVSTNYVKEIGNFIFILDNLLHNFDHGDRRQVEAVGARAVCAMKLKIVPCWCKK